MAFEPILNIPHASRRIPPDVRPSLRLTDEELARELTVVTDAYVDELFELPLIPHVRIVYPVSRLVCDPERFADDAAEPMAHKGLGAIYERTSAGRPLRAPPSQEERQALLARYFEPHHQTVRDAVAAALGSRALLLDLHSFASRPLPYEPDQDPDRADICLGTHALHTPPRLLRRAVDAFEAQGFRIAIDKPYAGTFVPEPYYGNEGCLFALMIEVNRGLYLNEATGEKSSDFEACRARLSLAVTHLLDGHGWAFTQTVREAAAYDELIRLGGIRGYNAAEPLQIAKVTEMPGATLQLHSYDLLWWGPHEALMTELRGLPDGAGMQACIDAVSSAKGWQCGPQF